MPMPDNLTDAAAREWINSLGYGTFEFNGDFNPMVGQSLNNPLALNILGAQQALGITDADLARILGPNISAGQIQDVYNSFDGAGEGYSDRVASFGRGFINEYDMGDPSAVQDRYLTTRNPDGTYTYTERAGTSGADNGPARGYSLGGRNDPNGGRSGGMGSMDGGFGNPYLDAMAGRMSQQYTNTLRDQWLPAIQNQSIASGGLGGSRQGVAQGLAIDRAGQGLSGALAGLYGGAWESDQNRALQQYGIDTNADLQNQSQWMNYDLGNQGMDLSRIGLGAQLMSTGTTGPWAGLNNAGNIYGSLTGNGTTTSQSNSGGGWQGLVGGALAGGSLANQFGWW